MTTVCQISRTSWRTPLAQYFFEIVWALFCAGTPKPFNAWRVFWVRAFGGKVSWSAFIHPRARITRAWNLTMAAGACLGDRAGAYCLGPISLGERATVAQEVYLCGGAHDFASQAFPLPETNAPIVIGADAFIGARAFILPGVTIGAHAIVGACSVVTSDVGASVRVAGNPAKEIPHA